jgi:hypothetical protein
MTAILDTRGRTAPHGDPLLPLGAHWAAATVPGTCPACAHYRSDCICWYLAELGAGERDEADE